MTAHHSVSLAPPAQHYRKGTTKKKKKKKAETISPAVTWIKLCVVLKCMKGKNHFGINPLLRELLNVQKIRYVYNWMQWILDRRQRFSSLSLPSQIPQQGRKGV